MAPSNAIERVHEAVEACQWDRERIVLMTGSSAEERSAVLAQLAEHYDFPCVNIGVELSQRLLDNPSRKRPIRARTYFRDLVDEPVEENGKQVVGLDHIELLFVPELELDVFGLLRSEAANRTLVVSWCGRVREEGEVVYAEPSHPEYWTEPVDSFRIVHLDT
jgi:hypothetical protein